MCLSVRIQVMGKKKHKPCDKLRRGRVVWVGVRPDHVGTSPLVGVVEKQYQGEGRGGTSTDVKEGLLDVRWVGHPSGRAGLSNRVRRNGCQPFVEWLARVWRVHEASPRMNDIVVCGCDAERQRTGKPARQVWADAWAYDRDMPSGSAPPAYPQSTPLPTGDALFKPHNTGWHLRECAAPVSASGAPCLAKRRMKYRIASDASYKV